MQAPRYIIMNKIYKMIHNRYICTYNLYINNVRFLFFYVQCHKEINNKNQLPNFSSAVPSSKIYSPSIRLIFQIMFAECSFWLKANIRTIPVFKKFGEYSDMNTLRILPFNIRRTYSVNVRQICLESPGEYKTTLNKIKQILLIWSFKDLITK